MSIIFLFISLFLFQQTPVSVTSVNLRDFGAVGDDAADDSAGLQKALAHVAGQNGLSTRLVIPAGIYQLSSPVAIHFAQMRSDLIIEGTGSGAVFHISSGQGTTALSLTGASSVMLKNLIFVGTPGDYADARIALNLDDNVRTIVENVTFYGLSSTDEGGAVMRVARTDFSARNLYFEGSNGYGFKQVPALLIEDWAGVDVQNFRFVDYGVLNGVYHSKNAVAGEAWIKLLNPYGQSQSQGIAMFRNGFFDEGAYVGLLSRQTSGDAIVTVEGLGCNISNTVLGQGVVFEGAKVAKLAHSKFGFSTAVDRTIANFVNVERAELDGVRGTEQAKNVYTDAATRSLSVRNSSFAYLSSKAKTTTIFDSEIGSQTISGKLVGEDPVITSVTGMPVVTGINGHPTNGGGGGTRTYWVVAVDAQGRRSRLSAPFVMPNAWGIGRLNSPSNLVHNLSWSPVPGAVGYDVLRDSTDRRVASVTVTNCQDRTESTTPYNTPEGNESAVYLMDGVQVATTAAPSWSTPSLKNGWAAFGAGYQSPQYSRHNGLIYLRGRVKSGTALSAIASLPTGYCPRARLSFAAVEVLPDCSIVHASGSNAAVNLDGIVFAVN